MKILIVEDEPKTGDYLKQGLAEAGFVADLVRDGIDGRHQALTQDYDLVVLDVMLPGLDGWQVLRDIRAAGRQCLAGLQVPLAAPVERLGCVLEFFELRDGFENLERFGSHFGPGAVPGNHGEIEFGHC